MSYTEASMLDGIHDLLRRTKTIAVIGWSPDRSRPSARVASYLRRAGYDVIPVNPNVDEIDGLKAFARLDEIPGAVDLALIFRRPAEAASHVDEAIAKRVRGIWLQEGITVPDGARKAAEAGIDYVEDRCAMVEHRRRFRAQQ
jgi:predicted CoA-binding protein